MLPHWLADDLCSLRPNEDRLSVTVEMPPRGEPQFYRSVIRSRARLTYAQAQRREGSPEIIEQFQLADEMARELRRRRLRARRAPDHDARGRLPLRRRTRRRRMARERAPGAHAGRGADDPARTSMSPRSSRAGTARRSTASTSSPIRRRSRSCSRSSPISSVPTPPVPEHLTPQAAADLAGEISQARHRLLREVGAWARGISIARPARAEAGPLRPAQPRPYRPREHGVLPLHLADPPLPGSHRPPRAPAGDRPGRRLAPDRPRRARRAHLGARARGGEDRIRSPMTSASRGCSNDRLHERGWEEPWEGEIIGMIGGGLFVRFGDVFEGMLPARKLPGDYFELNATGTGDGRPPLRARLPARRRDLGSGRVDREQRGQGRARARLRACRPPPDAS